MIERLIEAGMSVARLNFSHGTHDDHRAVCEKVRQAAAKLGANVAVLLDLQGPKIRVGPIAAGPVHLDRGRRFTLTARSVPGDIACISTTYADLAKDVQPGDALLLDDGAIRLRALEVTATDVVCEVVDGGVLSSHKGLNLPGVAVSAPALTEKDVDDLALGVELGVDWIALSFVRRADDLRLAQGKVRALGATIPVIAKLEKPEALDHLDEILAVADGLMVARGDLGVELSPERVPVVQKELIRAANRAKIPVITATQMLESMTHHPRPTRAEASDVANAVYDGTDAVMLSGETAVGEYPVETVAMMSRIVEQAERDYLPTTAEYHEQFSSRQFPEAIAEAAAEAAGDVGAKLVVGFTQSGGTARLLSKYRPSVPLVVFARDEVVQRRLALLWGVEGRLIGTVEDTEHLIAKVDRALVAEGTVDPGDTLVVVTGSPLAARGPTNLMKLHRVGEA
jgi:pyruvate kinase